LRFDNARTQTSAEAIEQRNSEDTTKRAQDKAAHDKKRGKEEAQQKELQDFSDVVKDKDNPWPGLSGLGDWINFIRLGLEELGRDSKGEVKEQWHCKVRNTIRGELKMNFLEEVKSICDRSDAQKQLSKFVEKANEAMKVHMVGLLFDDVDDAVESLLKTRKWEEDPLAEGEAQDTKEQGGGGSSYAIEESNVGGGWKKKKGKLEMKKDVRGRPVSNPPRVSTKKANGAEISNFRCPVCKHEQESIMPNLAAKHLLACLEKNAHSSPNLSKLLVYTKKLDVLSQDTTKPTKRGFRNTIKKILKVRKELTNSSRNGMGGGKELREREFAAAGSVVGGDGKGEKKSSGSEGDFKFKCPGCKKNFGPYPSKANLSGVFGNHQKNCEKKHPGKKSEFAESRQKLGIKLKETTVCDKISLKEERWRGDKRLEEGGCSSISGGGGGGKETKGSNKSAKEKEKQKNGGNKRLRKDEAKMVPEVRGAGVADSEVGGSAKKRTKRAGSVGARSGRTRVLTSRLGHYGGGGESGGEGKEDANNRVKEKKTEKKSGSKRRREDMR